MQTGGERLKTCRMCRCRWISPNPRRIADPRYFVAPRSLGLSRGLAAEVPQSRMKILRDAFMAMGRDPEFNADIRQAGIDADLAQARRWRRWFSA